MAGPCSLVNVNIFAEELKKVTFLHTNDSNAISRDHLSWNGQCAVPASFSC